MQYGHDINPKQWRHNSQRDLYRRPARTGVSGNRGPRTRSEVVEGQGAGQSFQCTQSECDLRPGGKWRSAGVDVKDTPSKHLASTSKSIRLVFWCRPGWQAGLLRCRRQSDGSCGRKTKAPWLNIVTADCPLILKWPSASVAGREFLSDAGLPGKG